ncbi:MAG TPA: DUF4863 family protein [Nevskiaceae bacterium]|nr:DUF4863 family protein [Nevskiaceae bacterium]
MELRCSFSAGEHFVSRKDFDALIGKLTAAAAGRPLDAALATQLNTDFGAATPVFHALREACLAGVREGWLCNREGGGIRYGRVVKPTSASHNFSVDVVDMREVVGPHHVHPNGEIDLVLPLEGDARFDGHGAGWMVYGAGSAHSPTVAGGRALVLYLLPGGAIEFTRSTARAG